MCIAANNSKHQMVTQVDKLKRTSCRKVPGCRRFMDPPVPPHIVCKVYCSRLRSIVQCALPQSILKYSTWSHMWVTSEALLVERCQSTSTVQGFYISFLYECLLFFSISVFKLFQTYLQIFFNKKIFFSTLSDTRRSKTQN
jgi:hypothetical protein